jgi:DNA-binding PadR family transcriptional regulator
MAFRGDLESLILGVLQEGDLHGYEIAKRIKRHSESLLSYGEGQMYPALHALEAEGAIVACWETQEGKPARRVYALTSAGGDALAERRAAWERFQMGVNRMLSPKGEGGVVGG